MQSVGGHDQHLITNVSLSEITEHAPMSASVCSDKTVDFPGWAELGQWIFVLKDIYQISAWLSLTSLDQYSQLIKDSYQPQHMGTGTTCRGNILRFYFTVCFSVMKAVSAILQSFCILGCQPHKVSSRVSIIVCCCGQFWLSYDNMNSLNINMD